MDRNPVPSLLLLTPPLLEFKLLLELEVEVEYENGEKGLVG
jgi:hypothetical protein